MFGSFWSCPVAVALLTSLGASHHRCAHCCASPVADPAVRVVGWPARPSSLTLVFGVLCVRPLSPSTLIENSVMLNRGCASRRCPLLGMHACHWSSEPSSQRWQVHTLFTHFWNLLQDSFFAAVAARALAPGGCSRPAIPALGPGCHPVVPRPPSVSSFLV